MWYESLSNNLGSAVMRRGSKERPVPEGVIGQTGRWTRPHENPTAHLIDRDIASPHTPPSITVGLFVNTAKTSPISRRAHPGNLVFARVIRVDAEVGETVGPLSIVYAHDPLRW